MRQFIYSGARLGFYKQAEDRIKDKENRNMTIWEKAVWSLFAGGIGSLVTTPTDVALIRLQNDNNLPEEKRRNYKNVFDALGRIYREEGVKGMWTGATPTVIRAMAINCSMLVSYNSTKENLMKLFNTKEETLKIRLLSSAVCGVAITTVSLPFDNIKTKLMRMKKGKNMRYFRPKWYISLQWIYRLLSKKYKKLRILCVMGRNNNLLHPNRPPRDHHSSSPRFRPRQFQKTRLLTISPYYSHKISLPFTLP